MHRLKFIGLCLGVMAVALVSTANSKTAAAPTESKIQRGDYITHSVAMCVQCHTPRDSAGNLIQSQEFTGAPIPVAKPEWADFWAFRSANIRGLAGWSDAEAVHLLVTGARFNGRRPNSPMPQFRLSPPDAEAVVAYLKSLQ